MSDLPLDMSDSIHLTPLRREIGPRMINSTFKAKPCKVGGTMKLNSTLQDSGMPIGGDSLEFSQITDEYSDSGLPSTYGSLPRDWTVSWSSNALNSDTSKVETIVSEWFEPKKINLLKICRQDRILGGLDKPFKGCVDIDKIGQGSSSDVYDLKLKGTNDKVIKIIDVKGVYGRNINQNLLEPCISEVVIHSVVSELDKENRKSLATDQPSNFVILKKAYVNRGRMNTVKGWSLGNKTNKGAQGEFNGSCYTTSHERTRQRDSNKCQDQPAFQFYPSQSRLPLLRSHGCQAPLVTYHQGRRRQKCEQRRPRSIQAAQERS